MVDPLVAVSGLVIAVALLWLRRNRVRRRSFRVGLVVLAVLFAYPAVNAAYIAAKQFVAGMRDR